MRSRNVRAFSTALMLAALVLAQPSGKAQVNTAQKVGPGQPVFMPGGDLKWTDLDPNGAPGVKIADLWGDHAKGAFGAFVKLPAGFAVPLHTHTHAMKVVFLSGTYIQAPEGKAEVRLVPGSYMMQPGWNPRAHDLLLQGVGLRVLFGKRRSVRPQPGGGRKRTCEEVTAT